MFVRSLSIYIRGGHSQTHIVDIEKNPVLQIRSSCRCPSAAITSLPNGNVHFFGHHRNENERKKKNGTSLFEADEEKIE